MSDINLLPPEIRVLEKRARFGKLSATIGVAIFSVSLVATLVVGITYFLGRASLLKTQNEVTSVTASIAALKSLEQNAAEITGKYKEITNIFKTRELYSKFFNSLNGLVPQDVTISEVNFLATTKVSISGVSTGYLSLASFIKTLEDPLKSQIFETPVLNSVVLNSQTGQVNFVMEVSIKSESLLQKL